MDILTIKLASEKWGISARRISALCEQGRIPGAVKTAGVWLLPPDSQKPADARIKNEKYIDWRNKTNMSNKDYDSNIKNIIKSWISAFGIWHIGWIFIRFIKRRRNPLRLLIICNNGK